jgi:lipopolysaccharide cholinephosphotransferase
MKAIDSEELKRIQVDILKAVCRFCEDAKLRYFLCAGTMLGAIRHKGFIPWDDDIDIMMPRPDYEIFVRNFKADHDYYKVYSISITKDYDYLFAKVSDERTLLLEKFNENKIGVNIDVFPIDGFPSSKFRGYLHYLIIKIFKCCYVRKIVTIRYIENILKKIIITIWRIFLFAIPKSVFSNLIQKKAKKIPYETSKLLGIVVWGYGKREICRRDVFNDYILVEFENNQFRAMIGYDEYLNNVYGDYMKFPPIEKRKSYHKRIGTFWK